MRGTRTYYKLLCMYGVECPENICVAYVTASEVIRMFAFLMPHPPKGGHNKKVSRKISVKADFLFL